MDPDAVLDQVARLVPEAPGRLRVAIRTSRGIAWGHEPDVVVPAASTIKTAVLLALLESGTDWTERLPLPGERVGGAGALELLASVSDLPAAEVATLMIALSDNDATNALIDHLDLLGSGATLRAVLHRAGARRTVLQRRLMDSAAAAASRDNLTTAADQAALLVALRSGTLLPPERTERALAVLRTQQDLDGVPAFLPADVQVGGKTGSLPGVRHDVFLLERGDAWAVVAALGTDLIIDGVDRQTDLLPVSARLGALVARLIG